MVLCSDFLTAWQQLRIGQINCQQALQLLHDEQGMLTLSEYLSGDGKALVMDMRELVAQLPS